MTRVRWQNIVPLAISAILNARGDLRTTVEEGFARYSPADIRLDGTVPRGRRKWMPAWKTTDHGIHHELKPIEPESFARYSLTAIGPDSMPGMVSRGKKE